MLCMKKPSSLKSKIVHAIARRIKANQAERAGVFAFKEEVPKTQRKSSSISKALSKGAFVVGGLAMSPVVLQAWAGTVYWISGSHNLNSQHNILGYMSSNSFSQKTTWQWSWGSHNVYNKFYYHSGGGIDGYYCTNWDCNGSVTLVGNQAGTYTLHQLQYNGGDLNLQINGSGGSGELSIGGGGGSPPNVNITSYYGTHFTDNWNAQSVSFTSKLSVAFTTLTTHGNHGTTANNATLETSNGGIININDSSHESFTNTTFSGSGAINLNSSNITFNNVTFNNSANSTITDNGTLSLQGHITLQQNSPLNNLASTITLSNDAIFNITKSLGSSIYNLLGTSKTINYNGYTSHLWNLIHYQNATGSLYTGDGANPTSGNGLYHVAYTVGDKEYIFGETFNNNSISMHLISFIGPPQSIWDGVYSLEGTHNYEVGGGIGYVDSNNHELESFGGAYNHNFTININPNENFANGTLVLGNQTPTPVDYTKNSGSIWLGENDWNTNSITGTFNAHDIYMTNTFQTGNKWGGHAGGTVNMTFHAYNNLTLNDLHFFNHITAIYNHDTDYFTANKALSVTNSKFDANSGGTLTFNGDVSSTFNNSIFNGAGSHFVFDASDHQSQNPTITMQNSNFTGNLSSVAMQAKSIALTGVNFNNTGNSNISLAASQSLNLTNTSFNDGMASVSLNATNTLSDAGTSTLHAKDIDVTAQTASFTNTTFELDPTTNGTGSFKVNNLTFNNDTFNGLSNYNFSSDGGTQNTTFQGTTTINTNNGQSPLAHLGAITLSNGARFDIKKALSGFQVGQAYQLLSGTSINYASDTEYAKNLWQMVHFGQASTTLDKSEGNDTYLVNLNLNGQTYQFQEQFSNNALSLTLTGRPPQDVWMGVYPLNGAHTYNVGNGIAYINPNVCNSGDEGCKNHTLSTYSGGTHSSATVNITGDNATLVIGNNQKAVATGGTINTANSGLEYHTSVQFNAANIYMTNNFQIGYSNGVGETGNAGFKAAKSMDMEGLNFTTYEGSHGVVHAYSTDWFEGDASMTINNSNFAATGGIMYFSSPTMNVNHSSFSGNGTTFDFNIQTNQGGDANHFSFQPQNITMQNSNFTGNLSSVAMQAKSIALTGVNFNNTGNSNISLSASQSLNLTNTSFNDGMASVSLNATNTLSDAGTSTLHAKDINVTAQTASFTNTTFELDPTTNGTGSFKVNNLTFNNDTFNGLSNYNFSNDGGTQNTTFQGTTTISTTDLSTNPNSPFKTLGGNVTLGSNALFNITSSLSNTPYTLLHGSNINWSDDSYAKNLWNLVDYQGMKGTLLQNDGNNTYTVAFGDTVKAKETFSHDQITLTLLTQTYDLWPDVYNMTPGCVSGSILGIQGCLGWAKGHYNFFSGYGYKTYNVSVGAGGIAYIDPNLKNASAPYYNPAGKQLTAYSFAGNGGTYDIQGQGTLVLGNITTQAASGGLIQFGGEGANPGYIVDVFNAYNIYLTNGISVGNFGGANGAKLPYGGGATMTFNATNNLTTDGLTYTNNLTYFNQACAILPSIFGSVCHAIKPQASNAYFVAGNTLDVQNSNFSDHVVDYEGLYGTFQFEGKQQVDFTGSNVQGNRTLVYVQGSKINLANSGFFLGDESHIVLTGDTDNLTQYMNGSNPKKTPQDIPVQGTLTATDTTFNLNTGSSVNFATNTTLSGNSLVMLNNGSIFKPTTHTSATSATFKGVANIQGNTQIDAQQSQVTFSQAANFSGTALLSLFENSSATFNGLASFAGNSLVNLDSNNTITFNQGANFTDNASVMLQGSGASATFAGSSSFAKGTSLQVNAGASIHASTGSVAFNGGHVNVSNGSVALDNISFNGAQLNIQGNSTFSANQVSSTGDTNFGLYGSGDLTFGSLNVASGVLNINSQDTRTSPLISVGGNFNVTGLLNLGNINLSGVLGKGQTLTYDVLNAKNISGISGADGYQKIELGGLQITNTKEAPVTYNATKDSWSFVNPLNWAQIITESVQNGHLEVTISQNLNPIATNLYNIAPELYFYKQSNTLKDNVYSYTDNRVGTFFLDGQIKGVYDSNGVQEIPGTYDAYNNPNGPLNIFNTGVSKGNLMALAGIASDLLPTIEQLLASGILNDLSDPNKLWQELQKIQINLTPTQKQALLNFINGFDSHINQTFNNGALVVGGEQVGQTPGSSTVWFGGAGFNGPCVPSTEEQSISCQLGRHTYLGQLLNSSSNALGYIEAQFNAKNVYITGTVGSGNEEGTGGSAAVSFNSDTNLVLNKANIEAQGTDQIFNLFGFGTVQKMLGQPQLGELLGQWIYDKAKGGDLIPQGLKGLLPSSVANATLGEIFNAQDMAALTQLPGFATVVKDILTHQSVDSLFGPNGLLQNLPTNVQNEIDSKIEEGINQGISNSGKLSGIEQGLVHKLLGSIEGGQGVRGIYNYLDNNFGNQTLWNVMDELAPWTNITLNKALAMGDTPAATKMMQSFMDKTTFGQIFNIIFQNSAIINKSAEWLGPQVWGVIMNMAISDVLNPPKALSKMVDDVGAKLLDQILGSNILNTLTQQKALDGIIGNIMKNKGLGGLWSQGLGALLPPNIKQAMEKAGVGSYLAPKGLSALWEKGYFTFSANDNVVSNNSTYSNATGGALSFIAGKSIVFSGTNNINFTNYQGTLNFYSNNLSNINLSSLNATDGLNLNAQFENLNIAGGQINLNQYESLNVSANNFKFLGTITDTGGVIDFSGVTGANVIGTLNLQKNSTLSTNNLSIYKAFNNQSTNAISVGNDLNLYSGATLTTQAQGINVGGALNSQGDFVFNLNNSTSSTAPSNTPLIEVQGIANLQPTSNKTPLMTLNASASTDYTLIDSDKWINYSLYNQTLDPNSWKDYLTLYTYLNINGKSMQLNKQGNGLLYNGKAVSIADRGLLVSYQNAQGQTIDASIAYNSISVGVGKPLNVGAPNIEQYIANIQGQSSVDAVYAAGGSSVMSWLNQLLVQTKNTPLFAPYYLEHTSQANLVKIAKDISNSIDLVASPTLKNNATDILQINTYTQQMSRLAKLSSFASNDELPDFHDFLASLKGKKFASAVPNDMDIITAYSQRNKLRNNLWITGVGGASFVAGGTGTLYGINVGYDRFIKGVIVGGYAAYGYSGFHGNITNSASNNVNVGIYSRAFLKGRHEITGSANETWGYNNAYISATDPILSVVNQRYKYSTWTTNLRANYGYDFFFKDKRVILKPQIGLAYYYIGLSGLQGMMNNPFYNQFRANADPANKSVLTLNLALESRHYFNKNSYYFVIADIGRDLFVYSMGDRVVRFIGDDMLSYRKGGMYNTFAGLTTGGEVRIFRSFYINAGIGARFGLDYKDINITGNVGIRYAF
ncbi:putative vacuolating cytotoxin (VacA) paralog [Helicobacter heilmannii]|nr:putative vacuolating cytotoxin (VacA) paralog [Helicobacter heilmannii]